MWLRKGLGGCLIQEIDRVGEGGSKTEGKEKRINK
jgi:hypothetical protein